MSFQAKGYMGGTAHHNFQSPVQSAPRLEQWQCQGQHTSAIKGIKSETLETLKINEIIRIIKATHRKLKLGLLKVVLHGRGTWPLGRGWHPLNGDARSYQPEVDRCNSQLHLGEGSEEKKVKNMVWPNWGGGGFNEVCEKTILLFWPSIFVRNHLEPV